MERAIPCELPFFYFRSAQFNSSKNITFVPNLQEIFKVVKRTFLYINLVIALFFVLPVSQAKEKTFTVVIDAGHGGKDPGARGSSINEKAINLAVALRLGSLISEKHDDVKVIYTRKTDVFIELDERANIANRNKADLFISIHTNAVKRGSSVSCLLKTYRALPPDSSELFMMRLRRFAWGVGKSDEELLAGIDAVK